MAFTDRFKKSSNPVLSEERLQSASRSDGGSTSIDYDGGTSTVSGAVNKSFILGFLLLLTSFYAFANPSTLFVWGGAIGGLGLVIAMCYKPKWSSTLAPIYALVEGLFVGSISATYAASFGIGLVFQAILLTISLLFMMLFIYKTGIIKVTEKFRTGVVMATGAIFVVYMANIVLGMFGINIPFLHEGGMIGIGISVVIIIVATLNLLLDFDSFERIEAVSAPKYMEWFVSMGLIVTLVWLYLELLRLLSVLSGDD
ncbi:Bax inhibitor-1/YccA family protein [Neolewinella antarctica]|uniref:YccA/Bax inhibitor family protein n=1 Tax=Neolewinella antarctica TaxID=442734 RepID=A0ABX0X907_9BACT|nr:Bax inhibitor-1/YccA family protein [Neolewinella antarctica]NJC25748.1 putative YccA/Bax inhibitor family protein [Neolewinella antarctica]